MKKLIILVALAAIRPVFGQTDVVISPSNLIFKMSPQHLALNMLKVGLEKINKSGTRSFQFYLQAVANDKRDNYGGSTFGYDGIGVEFMIRKYLSPMQQVTTRKGRQFMQGIYFGGFIQGGIYSGKVDDEWISWDPITQTYSSTTYKYTDKPKNVATGFTIGMQRIYWKVLTLDAYIGAGYQISQQNISGNAPEWAVEYYDFTEANYQGILPKIGITIGLAL
jgi:hypothetical protein